MQEKYFRKRRDSHLPALYQLIVNLHSLSVPKACVYVRMYIRMREIYRLQASYRKRTDHLVFNLITPVTFRQGRANYTLNWKDVFQEMSILSSYLHPFIGCSFTLLDLVSGLRFRGKPVGNYAESSFTCPLTCRFPIHTSFLEDNIIMVMMLVDGDRYVLSLHRGNATSDEVDLHILGVAYCRFIQYVGLYKILDAKQDRI
jgi:hypothetical protein